MPLVESLGAQCGLGRISSDPVRSVPRPPERWIAAPAFGTFVTPGRGGSAALRLRTGEVFLVDGFADSGSFVSAIVVGAKRRRFAKRDLASIRPTPPHTREERRAVIELQRKGLPACIVPLTEPERASASRLDRPWRSDKP